MRVERDDKGQISVVDITACELEILQIAVLGSLEKLPKNKQSKFRRLAMSIDRYLNQNYNENHFRQSPILSPSDGTANQLQGKP